jgi:hypothetical protein
MKERVVTLAGALLAAYLVAALLVPGAPSGSRSLPTTVDAGAAGYLGLWRWLMDAGVDTVSLRRRYDTLESTPGLPASGNLLIITLPALTPMRGAEREALARWVGRGNAVMLVMALADAPAWAADGRPTQFRSLTEVLGFTLRRTGDRAAVEEEPGLEALLDALGTPAAQPQVLAPIGSHPVVAGVSEVAAGGLAPVPGAGHDHDHRLDPEEPGRSAVAILRDADGVTAAWWLRAGRGSAFVFTYSDLLANRLLGERGNTQFAANLIAAVRARQGAVVFDDFHQGLAAYYDAEAFLRDARLHASAVFLLALWLIYLVGFSNRFGPVTEARAGRSSADLARAVGGLIARRTSHGAAGLRLLEHFFDTCRRRFGPLQDGGSPWERLRERAGDRSRIDALERGWRRLEAGQRVDLRALMNDINHLKRTL